VLRDPGYYREALAEVERCMDAGMTGVKLYNQYTIDDPVMDPLLELAAERKFPVLMHAATSLPPRTWRSSRGSPTASTSRRRANAIRTPS